MITLKFSDFHSFLRAHPWVVLYAQGSSLGELNSLVVSHFAAKYGDAVPVAVVDLSDGHEWFSRDVRRWLGRPHASYTTAYYLVVGGKVVQHHSGHLSDSSAILVTALLESTISGSVNPFADASAALQRRTAADIVGAFEAMLTETPPPLPAPAPKATSTARDHYAALEIPRGASREQILAAYRKRAVEYHPDRVAALGRDLRELAERRMTEINAARDALLGRG
ncbi:MAG TPA: J domain-containing protein [Polyangiaceae bacterium]|nr:J domain-containing protein [Polyangiaceae bacterium]